YSPPPPGRPVATTSYFSTSLPFSPYTRLTAIIQRQAMVSASGKIEYSRNPETPIHCKGGQPLGASHCCPVTSGEVTMPPALSKSRETARATAAACGLSAIATKSGYTVAAEIRGTCARFTQP